VGVGEPLAAAANVTELPSVAVWLAGWVVNVGATMAPPLLDDDELEELLELDDEEDEELLLELEELELLLEELDDEELDDELDELELLEPVTVIV
jgi:hypothetical protein